MIKKFQQGGQQLQLLDQIFAMINQLPEEALKQLAQSGAKPEDIAKIVLLGVQQGKINPEIGKAVMQALLGLVAAAKHGAKLLYIKSLKHKCADDEELYYYKKGGSVGCGCKKKEDGGKAELKESPITKFKAIKKGRTGYKNDNENLKKLDPKTTKTLPGGKYPSNWTSQLRQIWEREHGDNDEGAATVSGIEHKEQPLPVKVKRQTKSSNNKPKPIVPKAKTSLQKCGGEIKKSKCGTVAKFKAARCRAKMKKK